MTQSNLLKLSHASHAYSYYQPWLALVAGMLSVGAFAPMATYFLAPLSLAILFKLWQHNTPKLAFFNGFFWGLGLFGGGINWVYISLTQFGGMSVWVAMMVVVGLVCLLALFPAGVGFFANKLTPPVTTTRHPSHFIKRYLITLPCLWVVSEWLRSHLFGGFPWLLLGYTTTTHPFLKGYAPVVGVFGLSFIVVLIASFFLRLLKKPDHHYLYQNVLPFCVFLAVLALGNLMLQSRHWTQASTSSLPIALLQGNISQNDKWNESKIAGILDTYRSLLDKNIMQHSLVVMPEAAIPVFEHQARHYLRSLNQKVLRKNSALITGIPIMGSASHYYNGMLVLGRGKGHYYKHHLVPFGEYIPFAHYLSAWVNRLITIPLSSLTAGSANQPPLKTLGLRIAPFICYEIAYADQVRESQKNTDLLLVLTDDSWFGTSWAAAQHLQIAQMRALENGRFLLFSSNNGITAVIDPQGNIIKQLPRFKQASLSTSIHPVRGNTPFSIWGSEPMILLALALIGGVALL